MEQQESQELAVWLIESYLNMLHSLVRRLEAIKQREDRLNTEAINFCRGKDGADVK
jgi:hypothetical protein